MYRKILRLLDEDIALSAVAHMSQYTVRDLSREVALTAGDLSVKHKLGMADAIVLAHAQTEQVPLFTLDFDFSSIHGVINLRTR